MSEEKEKDTLTVETGTEKKEEKTEGENKPEWAKQMEQTLKEITEKLAQKTGTEVSSGVVEVPIPPTPKPPEPPITTVPEPTTEKKTKKTPSLWERIF